MGRCHRRHPGAYPHHAGSSSYTTTAGDVLPQQVRLLFAGRVFTPISVSADLLLLKLQEVEWFVLVGIEVASYGGLQKIVG